MRSTSLREQLMRAAMLTTSAAVLLSACALLAYELATFRKAWVVDLRTQADLIARSTAAALEFDDNEAAHESLRLLNTQPRIQSAVVYGPHGTLFASYSVLSAAPLASRAEEVSTFEPRFRGSTLELAYPIERAGERLGTLYLSARHDIWARFGDFALIVLSISALSLACAFYLFSRLQRRITAPLEKMTEVAQEVISSQNWALRAPETHYRDVGVLVEAFNRMLLVCQTRTSALEQEMVTRQGVERDLRLADRQKDVFLATLAHELRNPLAPMTSAVALLQIASASPTTREKAVVVLDRQIKHMVRLINDLLDASRVATGKLSLDVEALDISELLSMTLEAAETLALRQGLTLTLNLSGEPLFVKGDATRLAQVFSNLLNNACRYTPHGGRVDVSLSANATEVCVAVRDTGIGVEANMQERIFELFEQADQTLERGSAGLGVGLTLARQIVQLHHGRLTLVSGGRDKGSCFSVWLPRLEFAGADPRDDRPAHQGRVRSLRILIADDNVDLADSFAELLRTHGHVIDVVHDGEAAVQAAKAAVPDIALLDIGMPGQDGYEVARQLRNDPGTSGIYLVAITGWGSASDKAMAESAGFDHHMLKPVEPDTLVKVLVDAFEEFSTSRPGGLV